MVEKRREVEAPQIQAAVFALIVESGLEPKDLGFRLHEGASLPVKGGSKRSRNQKVVVKAPVVDAKSLEGLSIEELQALLNDLTQVERTKKSQIQKAYRTKIWSVLKRSGVLPEHIGLEVVDGRYQLRPKYVNPDTNETWAGRGKVPKWLRALEAQGRDRTEFLENSASDA
ncbi:MAG: H-NS histone family protein [Planctomycetes bacterium]|nr:H-NS histone family protein [Planctomycetota bacterium]